MTRLQRFVTWFGTVESLVAMHLWLTWFWIIMIIPTVIWWRTSIPWVGFMSVWALVATHWGAYQGGRSERFSKQAVVPKLEPLDAVIATPLKACETCGFLKREPP